MERLRLINYLGIDFLISEATATFDETELTVCENSTLSVSLTNNGPNYHFVCKYFKSKNNFSVTEASL